jgi:hypothetical protein
MKKFENHCPIAITAELDSRIHLPLREKLLLLELHQTISCGPASLPLSLYREPFPREHEAGL